MNDIKVIIEDSEIIKSEEYKKNMKKRRDTFLLGDDITHKDDVTKKYHSMISLKDINDNSISKTCPSISFTIPSNKPDDNKIENIYRPRIGMIKRLPFCSSMPSIAKSTEKENGKLKEYIQSKLTNISRSESDRAPLSVEKPSVEVKKSYIENSRCVTVTGNLGAVEPKQLAKNLFNLVNISKDQVTRILCRKDAYHREACREYMLMFDLDKLRIDEALRLLMKKIPFIGETHSIEKMLTYFSHHYWSINKEYLKFNEAICHIVICSLLILNSDLHSKIQMKKMNLNEYIANIYSVCGKEENLPTKEYLTDVYKHIKKKPLPVHVVETTKDSKSNKSIKSLATLTEDKNEFPILKSSPLYWKECKDVNMSFAPLFSFHWRLSFVSLKGPQLIFHKKELILDKPQLILNICHAIAKINIKPSSSSSSSKRNLFNLNLITGKCFLLSDSLSSNAFEWISHINMAAAILSSPALPLTLGNPPFYTKLLTYPSQIYSGPIKDLYIHIKAREKELFNMLELNLKYEPKDDEKQMSVKSINLLQQEIDRYGKYRMMLLHCTIDFIKKFIPSTNYNSLDPFQQFILAERDSTTMENSEYYQCVK